MGRAILADAAYTSVIPDIGLAGRVLGGDDGRRPDPSHPRALLHRKEATLRHPDTPDLRPALLLRLRRFRNRMKHVHADASAAQVHAFRIACRALLACYPLFNTLAAAQRWRKTVRKSMKALNRLRDLQQMQERLASQPALIDALQVKIDKAQRRWRKYEPALHTTGFRRALARAEAALDLPAANPSMSLRLLNQSCQQWEDALLRVNRRLQNAGVEDLESLHRLRVRYKALRYLVELWLDAGIPLSVDKKALKRWQVLLGEVADFRVMAAIAAKLELPEDVQQAFSQQAHAQAALFLAQRDELAQLLAQLDHEVNLSLKGEAA